MHKIDAHHHFWRYDPVEYDWIDESMKDIRRDFLPADLQAEIHHAGVEGVVSVQARQTVSETEWLLKLAGENEFIKGVVGWVPLTEPSVSETLSRFAVDRKLKSVRHVLQGEADPGYMLRPEFERGLREVTRLGLSYDVLVLERQLPQIIHLVDRHPDQVFVVDHLAKPRVKDHQLSPWKEQMAALAKRPHVYCKISGLATEAAYHNWSEDELRPYIDVVLNAFGPRRCMFGSDWPVCKVAIDYNAWVHILQRALAKFTAEEQARVWAGTAAEAYRLG